MTTVRERVPSWVPARLLRDAQSFRKARATTRRLRDGRGTNALVVKEQFDNAGNAVDETHVVLQYVLRNAPPGYTGDASHSLVAPGMQSTLAATDEVIAKSLGLRNIAQAQKDDAMEIWSRAQ